jgi:N-acetylglutamate synthase-like GNAT family acetyltransferase
MATIHLEPFTEKYKDDVPALIVAIQRNEFGVAINLAAQPDLKNITAFYQTGNGNFWIALNGETVIGTIALLDIGNKQAALRKMFVHADFRGKLYHVGQSLLNVLLQWAGQKGFCEIFLGTTEKFVAAQRFYEKNGFIEIDQQLLPANFPVMPVDVKFYKYNIA